MPRLVVSHAPCLPHGSSISSRVLGVDHLGYVLARLTSASILHLQGDSRKDISDMHKTIRQSIRKTFKMNHVMRKVCVACVFVCVCVRVRYDLRDFLCPLRFVITALPNSLLLHTLKTSEKTSDIHKKIPKKFIWYTKQSFVRAGAFVFFVFFMPFFFFLVSLVMLGFHVRSVLSDKRSRSAGRRIVEPKSAVLRTMELDGTCVQTCARVHLFLMSLYVFMSFCSYVLMICRLTRLILYRGKFLQGSQYWSDSKDS